MRILGGAALLGWMALVSSAFPYPLLDCRRVFLATLLPLFVMLTIFLRDRKEEKVSPPSIVAVVFPWLLAGLFWANGAMDHSDEVAHGTEVIDTRYSYRSGIRDTLIVRSWRAGRKTEVSVNAYQRFFYPGDRVTVKTKVGALGFAWITSVAR